MNPIRAWDRFWFAPISARPLGAFRVAFGLICLLHLGLLYQDAEPWLTGAGYVRGAEARELSGVLRPSALHWIQSPPAVRGFLAGTAAVAVAFTLGWHTRVAGLLLYAGLLSIHHRNLITCSGADALVMVMAFGMALAPSGRACSLDARRASRKRGLAPAEPLIVPWAQRLVQLQLCVVYFMAALMKAGGQTWLDGSALHYVLGNGEYRRWTFGLTEYPLLMHALTTVALLTEFALPFLLWSRAARPWAILAGVGLHGGILLTINIPVFGELMMATYLVFLGPEELDAIGRVLDPRAWLRRVAGRLATVSAGRPAPALQAPHHARATSRTRADRPAGA